RRRGVARRDADLSAQHRPQQAGRVTCPPRLSSRPSAARAGIHVSLPSDFSDAGVHGSRIGSLRSPSGMTAESVEEEKMFQSPLPPQEHDRFPYSAIVDRPSLRWPNGARVAVWVIPNIEHFLFDRPSTPITHATLQLVPDVLNYSW